jgi:hypothetical protein
MKSLAAALLSVLFAYGAVADGPADNLADQVRRVPPWGVKVPEADRAELQVGLATLGQQIAMLRSELKGQPKQLELLPDVEVFHKAVRYALDYEEFHKTNEVRDAKRLLALATERANLLRAGKSPWLTTTGLVARGFVSKIDGSVQPYGLVVPDACPGCAPFRLDVWFHGRGETLSEVNFLTQRMKDPGQFTPPKTIVLHVYNRYCNPARFAGETDVFEAIAEVKKHYPIDEDRIVVRGFSMGGASCWNFATHHAWRWAAAAPGAGFSETAEFLKVFQQEQLQPSWWEQKLWRLNDATDWALNLYNVPTVAYSGEEDRQKQAADIMEKAMAREGMKLTHLIGPKTAHKYEPGAKKEIEKRIDAFAEKGRNPVPREVKFVTYTLRYNRMFWVIVDALAQHWERGEVRAAFDPAQNAITANTKGVTALTLQFDAGKYPLAAQRAAKVVLDGQALAAAPAKDGSFTAHFRRDGSQWKAVKSAQPKGLAKVHGLQGPIDDAFLDSFIFVRPTGTPLNPVVGKWADGEFQHAVVHWRQQFRGDARVVDDHAVTKADIANSNLVLWGDPKSNELLGRIAGKLPIRWTKSGIEVNGKRYDAGTHVPVLIFPNPLNPERYVVINSSFTYREYDYLNNARQTPKLPDWAVLDVTKPVTSRVPGAVVDAGFFGERWELGRQ